MSTRARTPLLAVPALTLSWLFVAAAALLLAPDGPPAPDRAVPWLVVLLLLVCSQTWVINLQLHREAHSLHISEIPVFVALLSLGPGHVVLVRALSTAIAFGVFRRQYRVPQKLLFNTALGAAEGAVAVLVFRLTAVGDAPPAMWLAAGLGTCVATGLSGVGVGLVIGALEGGLLVRPLVRLAARSVVTALPITCIGCCVWAAWESSAWAALPLVVVTAALVWAYRGYASLMDKHEALERLYRFSQAVSRAPALGDVVTAVLTQSRTMLRAERSWIMFPGQDEQDPAFEIRCDDDGQRRSPRPTLPTDSWVAERVLRHAVPVHLGRETRDPEEKAWLQEARVRDALLVPLLGTAGPIAVLAVENRQGDVRGFLADELPALEAVAHQAAVALRNGELLAQIQHEAEHDALTGLVNRSGFVRAIAERLTSGRPFAVAILDLDSFKEVNDTLGHEEGDRLLCEVAVRLTTALPDAAVARLGGDEFALLLDVEELRQAEQAAQRAVRLVTRPVRLAGISIDVSAALGLACSPLHGSEVSLLMKRADQALHDAKHQGREVRAFDAALDTGSPSRLALVAELREAIASRNLDVHLQPKASAASGELVGTEALARWSTASRGPVPPDDFIPLAERSGLIRPLTTLVLEKSAAACAAWQHDAPGVGVSVNLSVRSLSDPQLVDTVANVLRRTGLRPALLTLEITESHIMTDPVAALAVLERLRSLGVSLSIDDFGTGYSSLAQLRRLPVDELKIDRSFVQRMVSDADDAAIVRAIVDLARTMGLRTVAEGVEDRRTWDALRDLGVDEIQGWVFARPMPIVDFLSSRAPGSLTRSPVRPAG